jgi:hypothetical protein
VVGYADGDDWPQALGGVLAVVPEVVVASKPVDAL